MPLMQKRKAQSARIRACCGLRCGIALLLRQQHTQCESCYRNKDGHFETARKSNMQSANIPQGSAKSAAQ
jgi:hypothetical protein